MQIKTYSFRETQTSTYEYTDPTPIQTDTEYHRPDQTDTQTQTKSCNILNPTPIQTDT